MNRRLVLLAAFAAALFTVAPAAAQPEVTRRVTPGGLPFRHALVADQPLQTMQVAWPDPAAATPEKAALSALGPTLLAEGSRGKGRSALIEDMRDLQGGLSIWSDGWRLRGALSAPAGGFAAVAKLAKEVLSDPALPPAKLETEKRNAAVAWRQASENPETLARRLLTRLMLGHDAHVRAMERDPASLAAVTHADIVAWTRAALVKTGLEIVVAGPMSADEIAPMLDDLFGWMPAGSPAPPVPARSLSPNGKLIVLERPVVQTVIVMGGPTTLAVDQHLTRADMLTSVLGGGFQSRLYRSVRERLGAAYGVSTGLTPIDPRSVALSIRALVANDRAKEALAAIRDDYARFLTEGPTLEEIDALRVRVTTGRAEGLRRPGNVASLAMNSVLVGLPDDAMATYASRVAAYPLAEFNADLTRFPKPPMTTVVVALSAEGWGADCVIRSADEIERCR